MIFFRQQQQRKQLGALYKIQTIINCTNVMPGLNAVSLLSSVHRVPEMSVVGAIHSLIVNAL